jgi:hypothetical protein
MVAANFYWRERRGAARVCPAFLSPRKSDFPGCDRQHGVVVDHFVNTEQRFPR